jgi:UDP-glucose:(heptosyl)LPS alpha-1,3-glucosyltransferase
MERSALKIAVVRPYLTASKGGAERYARDLIRGLAEAGHDVHVFAHAWDQPEQPGVSYYKVAMPRKPAWLRVLWFHFALRRQLRPSEYDVVLGLTPFLPQQLFWLGDGLYAVWVRIAWPLALWRWLMCLKRTVMAVNLAFERKILSPATAGFIANSRLVARQARRFYGVAEKQISIVYPWIDTERFNLTARSRWRDEARRALAIEKDEIVLLFAANNFARKGLAVALGALAKLGPGGSPYRLIVAGAGAIAGFRRAAQRLGVGEKTTFVGAVADLERYYAAADIFILPTRYDPCATVCLEAMACGLPVITTAMNGAVEWIEDGENGLVLDADAAAQSVAARIGELASQDRRARAGNAAAERVRRLTPAAHLDEMLAVLKTFARRPGAQRVVQLGPDLWVNEIFAGLLERHRLSRAGALMEAAKRGEIEYNRDKKIGVLALGDGSGELEFFLKAHRREPSCLDVFRRLLGRPVPGEGVKEWRNFLAMQAAGIPTATPAAAGELYQAGAQQSFIMTLRLSGYLPLDDYIAASFNKPLSEPLLRHKRVLIGALAELARRLHGCGFNHQDFYLCHIFAKTGNAESPDLRIIDLQRVGYRRRPARRWIIKDLAQLHYSSMELPISERDRLRFVAAYWPNTSRWLRRVMLRRILAKSRAIGRHDAKLRARGAARQSGFEKAPTPPS